MPQAALREVLAAAGTDFSPVQFTGDDPVLPLRYRVGAAACGALGALGVSINRLTNTNQTIGVNVRSAAVSLRSARYLRVNGKAPAVWDPLSGFYPVRDGWISIHCNFPNHREAAMRVLGAPHERARAEEASRAKARRSNKRSMPPAAARDMCAALRPGSSTRRRRRSRRSRS